MNLDLKSIKGDVVRTVEVSDSLFGTRMNHPLVHQTMVMYQLNRRQGTHKTKTRSEVAGGGAKPWRQKHTGRARQGSIRSPQWRHGGQVFGPSPRSYRQDMPKKMRRLALRCVLSQKVRDGQLILIEDFNLSTARTKDMAQILNALGIQGSTLIVTLGSEPNTIRSAQNLPKVWTLPTSLLNAGEILKRNNIVMTLDAVRKAENLWASESVSGNHEVAPSNTENQNHDQQETREELDNSNGN